MHIVVIMEFVTYLVIPKKLHIIGNLRMPLKLINSKLNMQFNLTETAKVNLMEIIYERQTVM